ncbi:hypothetical protein [Streptomyces malaysiensis]|uniref:hypothetical protein n=1 Tax=Streptomyces malaysiensis TaxID=92644 RepID=UPI0011E4C9DD|nr:hypothetical protein [Streptomyces autolyticus]
MTEERGERGGSSGGRCGAVRPEAVGRQLWLVRVRCPSLYAAGGSSELAHTVTAVMDLRIEMMRARLATAHEYVTRRV